jgi:hypothetical protein
MRLPVWVFLTKEWLERNWKWLLFPVGLLLLLVGYVLAPRKKVVVTSSVAAEADKAIDKIDAEADVKRRQADATTAAQLAGISSQHSASVAAATQQQLDATDAAQGDSGRVNDLLLDVGRQMRNR